MFNQATINNMTEAELVHYAEYDKRCALRLAEVSTPRRISNGREEEYVPRGEKNGGKHEKPNG